MSPRCLVCGFTFSIRKEGLALLPHRAGRYSGAVALLRSGRNHHQRLSEPLQLHLSHRQPGLPRRIQHSRWTVCQHISPRTRPVYPPEKSIVSDERRRVGLCGGSWTVVGLAGEQRKHIGSRSNGTRLRHFNQNLLVAMGLTCEGYKIVLGLRQISAENTIVVKELLTDLTQRGIDFDVSACWTAAKV